MFDRRSRVTIAVAVPVLCALVGFGHASAQGRAGDQRVVSRLTGAELKALLEADGYRNVVVDHDDDVIFRLEGTNVVVFTAGDKRSLTFLVSWTNTNASSTRVNAWNRGMRYSRAYLDSDGDPCLVLDLDLTGGVTVARVRDYIHTAKLSISRFTRDVL